MGLVIVATCLVSTAAVSNNRPSRDGKRFETYDKYDRKMVESRPVPSIARIGYSPSSGDFNNAANPIQAQPEPSNLVSGLLVTRLASDSE